jgi:hypothetical protein
MTVILDIKQQNLITMAKFEDSIMTLDESFLVRRYKYSPRLEELRMYKESELIEGASLVLKYLPTDQIPRHITMSDTEVYIGSRFFQNYANMQSGRDANLLFERHRNKRIGDLSFKNLFLGPFPSIDQSHILYIKVNNIDSNG